MPFHGDRFRACWPGLLLLLVNGCGVGAYESKMLEAQTRVKRSDEEILLLDANPLAIPQVEKKEPGQEPVRVPIANVYLRAPRGIKSEADNPAEPRMGLFYTYDVRDPKAPGSVARVELAFGNQKDFAAEVLRCFGAPDKPGRPRLLPGATFETTELDDTQQYFYSINIWRGQGNRAVAVVYWIMRGQFAAATKVVDVSLGTFAVDAEADRLRPLQGKISLQPPRHQ